MKSSVEVVGGFRPLFLREQRDAKPGRGGQFPFFCGLSAGGIGLGHVFEAAPDDLGKRPFLGSGHLLGFFEEGVGNLDLCFYHDGNLPLLKRSVNATA